MQLLEHIVGHASDPEIAHRLHEAHHGGRVEHLTIGPEDMLRRRLRVTGDKGTEYAIAIPRDQRLSNGAVLRFDEERVVVVRASEQRWLTLVAKDAAAALQLGYFAGNMHWKVRFDGPRLDIALQGPVADYLGRLSALFATDRIERVEHD